MPIRAGKQVYSLLRGACSASGVFWTEVGLDAAIGEVAASILYDDPAQEVIGRILSDLPETGFDRTGTARAFPDMKRLENWRVGEFLADRYLTAHRACSFPLACRVGSENGGFQFAGSGACRLLPGRLRRVLRIRRSQDFFRFRAASEGDTWLRRIGSPTT